MGIKEEISTCIVTYPGGQEIEVSAIDAWFDGLFYTWRTHGGHKGWTFDKNKAFHYADTYAEVFLNHMWDDEDQTNN